MSNMHHRYSSCLLRKLKISNLEGRAGNVDQNPPLPAMKKRSLDMRSKKRNKIESALDCNHHMTCNFYFYFFSHLKETLSFLLCASPTNHCHELKTQNFSVPTIYKIVGPNTTKSTKELLPRQHLLWKKIKKKYKGQNIKKKAGCTQTRLAGHDRDGGHFLLPSLEGFWD